MKTLSQLIRYYQEGFKLLNNAREVILVGLALALLSSLQTINKNSVVLDLVFLILVFFYIGFNFSVPGLLKIKKEKGRLSLSEIWKMTRHITWVMVFPIIIFLILLTILWTITAVVFNNLTQPQGMELEADFARYSSYGFFAVVTFLGALLVFMPIYISVEKLSWWQALKRSISQVSKNLTFVFTVAIVNILLYVLLLIPPKEILPLQIISSLLNEYGTLVISATALVYYQRIISHDKKGEH